MKRVSKKQLKRLATYAVIRKEKLEEEPFCERCGALASQTHHKKGRGIYLDNKEFLMSICAPCHAFIHENPNLSREEGWIIDP